MTSKEIEANLEKLVANLNNEEFIFDLLLAYGISKTSVNRLKKGDFNFSKISGEVLYKNKLFFSYAAHDLHLKVDEFSANERLLKQNPRFVIVTDYKTLVAKDLKTKVNRDFPLHDLPKYFDFFLPLTGAEVYKSPNDVKADRDAAYKMAQLYDILVQDNPDFKESSHKLNIFLSRLLFCFFAEDTGIFEEASIFTETLARHTNLDGKDVAEFLNSFFKRLNTEDGSFPDYLQNHFPYVNGGLFRDNIKSPIFSSKSRTLLLSCGDLDWSEINPDIFGSMIQAVADPEERSDLGMHYTSVPNIKRLIEPLFLDALIEEFDRQYDNQNGLNKLLARLGQIKFFDPACGSGNFLIITYKEIRLLEIQIIKRIIELSAQNGLTIPLQFTIIKLSQFYGIEIKDFAHEMAILSLWLAEHQMNKVFDDRLEGFGQSKPILPLKEAGNITCANATTTSWEKVCPHNPNDEIYILGNPPYLGSNLHSDEQREEMQNIFKSEALDRLDYIGTWFILGASYIENSKAKLAFVTTNSITQGVQVPVLWGRIFQKDVFINFAVRSFKWKNNAKNNAGVSVAIIGLSYEKGVKISLYDDDKVEAVKSISPYLIKNSTTIVLPESNPKKGYPSLVMGNKPADDGNLILSEEERKALISEYPNSLKFIKRFSSADDLLNGKTRYCLWISTNSEKEAKNIPFIKQRTDKLRIFRQKSKAKSTKDYATNDYLFRQISYKNTDGIVIPRVSSERRDYIPLVYVGSDIIVSDATNIIYDAKPWLFGILHSKIHMVWVDAVGGKLKTDYRYSAKLCYNTFPFPEISLKQKENITQYVFDILDERAKYPEKTLAWMYNSDTMPNGLKLAHQALDEAIEKIYRLASFISDAERLNHLFKLYEELVKKDTLFAKVKPVKKIKSK